MQIQPVSYYQQQNTSSIKMLNSKNIHPKINKDQVSFTGLEKTFSGKSKLKEKLFAFLFPSKKELINTLQEEVGVLKTQVTDLSKRAQETEIIQLKKIAKKTPEQLKAEVESLIEASKNMLAEYKGLESHCVSRVEEVMTDCGMQDFIPWKWAENTKNMAFKEQEKLLQSLKTYGREFKNSKYPDLRFKIGIVTENRPFTYLKLYTDETATTDFLKYNDFDSNKIKTNNRNYEFALLNNLLSVSDFSKRNGMGQTEFLINIENNQLQTINQFKHPGDGLEIERKITFKDGKPVLLTEKQTNSASNYFTFHFDK